MRFSRIDQSVGMSFFRSVLGSHTVGILTGKLLVILWDFVVVLLEKYVAPCITCILST